MSYWWPSPRGEQDTRTDANTIESPAALVTSPGDINNPSRPSPSAFASVLLTLCPLDERLLMGGTIHRHTSRIH